MEKEDLKSQKKDSKGSMRSSIKFLFVVGLLYGLAFLLDAGMAKQAWVFSIKLLVQLAPVLLLVFVLMFISNLLVEPQWVKDHMGKDSGLKGWLLASIGGILSVGPIYAWFALLRDLGEKGMRPALISVFLYNRGIKLPLLPLMIHYFGLSYTLILAVYITIFSLLGGILLEKIMKKDPSSIG